MRPEPIFADFCPDDSCINGAPAIIARSSDKMIWTILGVSVAIVAVFCVTVAEMFVGHPVFEHYRAYIALAFAISGAVAWFIGRHLGNKRNANNAEEDRKIFVLFDLRYWGPMLFTLGVITLFIQTIKLQAAPSVAAAPPPPPKKVEVVVTPAPAPILPKTPVVFPTLKLQGVIFRGDHSAVIVNGRSYEQGDSIDDVVVKEITRDSVKIEKGGEVKLLSMTGMSRD